MKAERSMRILAVIETGGPGGAETVFVQLATGLRARGYEVHCITGRGSWLPAEMARQGFEVTHPHGGGGFNVSFLRQLIRQVREKRIELIHAHLFDGAVYASLAAAITGIPCVVTLHGQVDIASDNWKSGLKKWLLERTASRVVTVSQALREDISPALHPRNGPIEVIENGVPDRFADLAKGAKDSGKFTILTVGNIRPAKDYATALRAAAGLRDAGFEFRWLIAGQPDHAGLYEMLLEQREALKLAEYVSFLGFVADPVHLYADADAFVLTSSSEGFSLVLVEAMLAELAIVATACGGPQNIIRDGNTGLLAEVGNEGDIARKVLQIANSPELKVQIGKAARQNALQRFALESTLARYEALYKNCLMRAPLLASKDIRGS